MTGPYVLQYPWPAPMTLEASRGPHVPLDEGVPSPRMEGSALVMRGEEGVTVLLHIAKLYAHIHCACIPTGVVRKRRTPQVYKRETRVPHKRTPHTYSCGRELPGITSKLNHSSYM